MEGVWIRTVPWRIRSLTSFLVLTTVCTVWTFCAKPSGCQDKNAPMVPWGTCDLKFDEALTLGLDPTTLQRDAFTAYHSGVFRRQPSENIRGGWDSFQLIKWTVAAARRCLIALFRCASIKEKNDTNHLLWSTVSSLCTSRSLHHSTLSINREGAVLWSIHGVWGFTDMWHCGMRLYEHTCNCCNRSGITAINHCIVFSSSNWPAGCDRVTEIYSLDPVYRHCERKDFCLTNPECMDAVFRISPMSS